MTQHKSILKQLFGLPQIEQGVFNSSIRGVEGMGGNLVRKTSGDRVIWAIVIILSLISLLVVYSSTGSLAYKYSRSTESYLFKQFA